MNRDRREDLPVHHTPHDGAPIIQKYGLVGHPLIIARLELKRVPLAAVVDDFTCLEGWSVPSLAWNGPQRATVVQLARPRPEVAYATVSALDFAPSVSEVSHPGRDRQRPCAGGAT